MKKLPLILLLLAPVLIAFQNCSRFNVDPDSAFGRGLFQFASERDPSAEKVDADCMRKDSYHACLFTKNPVAQQRQTFSVTLSQAEVEPLQTLGILLWGILPTGYLENTTISIHTVQAPRLLLDGTNLRYSARGDSRHAYAQVFNYYWLTRTRDTILGQTGLFPAKGKGIRVYVDDHFSGWSPKTNSIHLKIASNGTPMSWSSELAIHFLGLASLHHATNGAINQLGVGRHRDCGFKPNGCCASQLGCSRAIASGVGDYFAAMIFPSQPTVGESWVNDVQGMSKCGVSRNLTTAAPLTAASAFNACASTSMTGDPSVLGTVYASIWWEMRKAAQIRASTGAQDIDTLFMHHLAELAGSDNFQMALNKIKDVDHRLFGGRYSQYFDAEFNRRGL